MTTGESVLALTALLVVGIIMYKINEASEKVEKEEEIKHANQQSNAPQPLHTTTVTPDASVRLSLVFCT